ncbi:carboxypeptidase B-like [Copidosoma floridanum]|uniref:carboxypeptidase B-like n=1 Tax=Copidosoma floridanum TaxID=29053 RepID=UPI0006C95358|nr:carboxypeptidase B-like [Copidosoma floridanum]
MRTAVVTFAVLAVSALASGYPPQSSIDGMQGLRVACHTRDQLDFVRKFRNTPGFDLAAIERDPTYPIHVFVAANQLEQFKRALATKGIGYDVFIDDVGTITREQKQQSQLHSSDLLSSFPPWDRVRDRAKKKTSILEVLSIGRLLHPQITSYLETLALTHGHVAKLINIGTSHEDRDILGVKITSSDARPGPRPAILVDAGIHAREWLGPATALYTIRQLAENASNSHVFDNVDIYVLPSINPDGYVHTHQVDRMWKKNRSPSADGVGCFGTDVNRNFDYKWRSSGNRSCDSDYSGPGPFSERESQALKHFVESEVGSLKVYVSLHSYGKYILHSWGDKPELPENAPKLECVARKAEAELSKVRGERYQVGSSYNLLYPVHGGSKDWALAVGGVDLTYTIELPSEKYGFFAPVSEIVPVGREVFEAIKVFAKYAEGGICQGV